MIINKLIMKYKEFSIEKRATIWFTVCNFILKGISFITVPIFTYMLSTNEYGKLSIFSSYQQIFLIFATFELSLGAFQRGILKYKEDIEGFTTAIIILSNFITIGLFAIIMIFEKFFRNVTGFNLITIIFLFLYFIVEPAYGCWLSKKRFAFDYKKATIFTLLTTIIVTLISVLSILFIKATADVKFISMLLGNIICYLPFYFKEVKFRRIFSDLKRILAYFKFALLFQLPLVFHSLSYIILSQADRIMIGKMIGNTEVAFYSVAYTLANIITIFQTSLNQVVKPWRFNKLEKKEYEFIYSSNNNLIIGMLIMIELFVLVAPEIVSILFSNEYYEAIWCIPPIALSVLFMFMYTIFSDIESYYLKTVYIMIASIVCAIANIILNYIGIIKWGYIACAYTTLICYILFALMHYIFMKRTCKNVKIGVNLINGEFYLNTSIASIIMTIILTMLYNYIIIRYIILISIIILIIIYRKKVYNIFEMIKR